MKPEMKPCFDALANALHNVCNGRPIVLFLNHGNWGDSLIREGAEAFLNNYGFRYYMVKVFDVKKGKVSLQQVKERLSHSDPVAVFNGGGSYDPRYDRLPFLRQLALEFSSNVFLPASYPKGMSDGFPEDSIYYARDKGQSLNNVSEARFCHDMAFFINPNNTSSTRKVGAFMREDGERPKHTFIPLRNRDISKEGRAHTPVKRFLREISRYETIYTNRLHVCIGAALLGRRVHFFPNDYFKNEMVFEASMKPNYPNVIFERNYDQLVDISPDQHSLVYRFKNLKKKKGGSGDT